MAVRIHSTLILALCLTLGAINLIGCTLSDGKDKFSSPKSSSPLMSPQYTPKSRAAVLEPVTESVNSPNLWPSERKLDYVLPEVFKTNKASPLIISLHGYGGSSDNHENYWNLKAATRKNGIILITPNGRKDRNNRQFWSAFSPCCNFDGREDTDHKQLRQLIVNAQQEYEIDRSRIAIMGHSNGGFMAYRMACEHADLITHVVSVAGSMTPNLSDCKPTVPLSVFHLHGTWDTIIKPNGQSSTKIPKEKREECISSACNQEESLCHESDTCSQLSACIKSCAQNKGLRQCEHSCLSSKNRLGFNKWTPLKICGIQNGCWESPLPLVKPYPSVEAIVSFWRRHNQCTHAHQYSAIDIDDSIQGNETRLQSHENCAQGTEVRTGLIEQGRHMPRFNANFADAAVNWFLRTPRQSSANQ